MRTGKLGSTEVGLAGVGVTDEPGGAAPARDSQPGPGGPGRPSGSHYGEPAIDGRHGRNERKVKACASPVYRKRSGDRKRRKSSADGASLSASWSAAGRVRGCRPLRHQVACRPCRGLANLGSGGLRSNGSVQRRSAPPGICPEGRTDEATHPGRKTGRMMRGCSSPLPLAGEVATRSVAGGGIVAGASASFAPSLTLPRERGREMESTAL